METKPAAKKDDKAAEESESSSSSSSDSESESEEEVKEVKKKDEKEVKKVMYIIIKLSLLICLMRAIVAVKKHWHIGMADKLKAFPTSRI